MLECLLPLEYSIVFLDLKIYTHLEWSVLVRGKLYNIVDGSILYATSQ